MHDRIGPWHDLDITDTDEGRHFLLTHPGRSAEDGCPDDCDLWRELRNGTIEFINPRFQTLPAGAYRLRSQWYDGLLQNTDGTEIIYPDPLADLDPVNLSPEAFEQLIDIGNAERNRVHHERICGCSTYPTVCANGRVLDIDDTGAFEISLPLILAAYERMRSAT